MVKFVQICIRVGVKCTRDKKIAENAPHSCLLSPGAGAASAHHEHALQRVTKMMVSFQLLLIAKFAAPTRTKIGRLHQKRKRPLVGNMKIFLLAIGVFGLCHSQNIIEAGSGPLDTAGTLECHRRSYTFRVTQADENGKQCWDTLSVIACWGRCDSNEISDWRFPYKKSTHPVCVHYGRNRAVVTLRHCEEGASPSAARYEYLEAAGCRCQLCSSTDTSCEGLRYRPHRSHPDALGFGA